MIAAVHATAPSWDQTDWVTICAAYDRLLRLTDSPVVRTNRALAVGFRDGPDAGLAALDEAAHDPGWPAPIWSRQCAPTCFGARAGRPMPSPGTGKRCKPTVPSPVASSCGAASPSAAASPPEEGYASAKLRVTDGSTGMPGPVVVDTVIFFR